MCLRFAGGVIGCRQLLSGCSDRLGRSAQRLRIGEHDELAGETCVPGTQTRGTVHEPAELVQRTRGRTDLASGEQGPTPVQGEIGARWVMMIEPLEGAPEKACRWRNVVAGQGASTRCRQVVRGAFAESSAGVVDRPELEQELVRLLEVPAHDFVVFT